MEAHEVVRRLSEWAGEVLTDDRTGVPPDAQLAVIPASAGFVIGNLRPGEERPRGGLRTRGFNLRIVFREDEDPESIERVGARLAAAIEDDPTLGGRFRSGDVAYRETRDPSVQERSAYEDAPAKIVRVSVSDFV